MNFIVIIPARFFSSRFPGKPLADIHGKPMIVRVMENALNSGATKVIVATDTVSIARAVESAGSEAEVCFTQNDHRSGTERLGEVAMRYQLPGEQIIVHLQGDEPLISSYMIRQVASVMHKSVYSINTNLPDIHVTTLATPLSSDQKAHDDNIVKVVVNVYNNALYFSRSVVPWRKKYLDNYHRFIPNMLLGHVGIYSYQVKFLYQYITWPISPLEELEMLEQLRILWNGKTIHVSIINNISNISVNTPEELKRINAVFKKNVLSD